jgi:hypothetical protein
MNFKFSYISLKDEADDFKAFALLPCLVFAKDYSDPIKSWAIMIVLYKGAFALTYTKPRIKKTYVMCKEPISRLLTKGKDYELIKIVGKCYYIKRDDGTQNVISKTRFHPPIKKYESGTI